MNRLAVWASWALLGVIGLVAGGCEGGGLKSYDVDVSLDQSLTAARTGAAEVDLIGVTAAEASAWRSYSLSSYFGGDDPMRAKASRAPIVFKPGSATKQTLARTDPIWNQWKQVGATDMVIMAQWPGGAAREVVPLDPAAWDDRRIGVVVQKSGLLIQGRKPEKTATKP